MFVGDDADRRLEAMNNPAAIVALKKLLPAGELAPGSYAVDETVTVRIVERR